MLEPSNGIAYVVFKIFFGSNIYSIFVGFNFDERVTKGGWNMELFWDRVQFRIFKRIEQFSLKYSSAVVS